MSASARRRGAGLTRPSRSEVLNRLGIRLRRRGRPHEVPPEVIEGVQMAEHTCRFQLKNELIVDVLRDDRLLNPDHYVERARRILGRLASDAEAAAIRMIDERGAAELAHGQKQHEHDYRSDDLSNLEQRERVYRAVARRLRGAMTERERLLGYVEDARQDAWDEISSNIDRQLGAHSAPSVRSDPSGRAAAAVRLIAVDLAELARSRRPQHQILRLQRAQLLQPPIIDVGEAGSGSPHRRGN